MCVGSYRAFLFPHHNVQGGGGKGERCRDYTWRGQWWLLWGPSSCLLIHVFLEILGQPRWLLFHPRLLNGHRSSSGKDSVVPFDIDIKILLANILLFLGNLACSTVNRSGFGGSTKLSQEWKKIARVSGELNQEVDWLMKGWFNVAKGGHLLNLGQKWTEGDEDVEFEIEIWDQVLGTWIVKIPKVPCLWKKSL